MQNQLIIATYNPGKIIEMKAILAPLEIEIITAPEINPDLDVKETGQTYSENARLKAMACMQETGAMSLADDSGIEVDLLDGAPGIYSARFSPKANANDADRRAYLLTQLAGKPAPWHAHFHCSAVLALPGGETIETHGRCDGIIITEERGGGGFGYDPIFYLPTYQATMAELPPEVKNRISHRAKALAGMKAKIEELIQS